MMENRKLIIFWESYNELLIDRTSIFKEFWEDLFNAEPYGETAFYGGE